ncbi:MAG: molecular chaperone HtpG [Candidatus Aminicenantes bacterium]|nr:molecular chaperone HtpG [Candidatus Aminicenantes bacterium]NIM80295.1 molecular chaperone HtpG [Candidatus Aminicenantes bacterium]NIN19642.1 molecular chaperone HtpG [Candidatus Aminicenantes bacterium]NIN43524.1 molecular chaperone HtpG [Candidatus Aminicenantes bacterium]NIN86269.1 molecular chaperone HtpG [Candidatus Aminicenantes bacterium]
MPEEKKTEEKEKQKAKKEETKTTKEKETKAKAQKKTTKAKSTKKEPPKAEEKKEKAAEKAPEEETPKTKAENYEFQSEVKQLLNILVYSLYKHKEVFLRELVSNAVDALNKVKFETLINSDIEDRDLDFRIDITLDKDKKKLIVEDTGIGMTKQELIDNIGTIARSGTLDFVKRVTEADAKDRMDLIGQFGVGFYSSFMAAEEIHVHTKSYVKGSKGLLWKSIGGNNYTIEDKGKKHRGTRIELHIMDDEKEFLEKSRIKDIINKHSKFVPFPIFLESEKIESVEAIWTQPKSSLKEKDYNEFYKFFQNANEDPATYLHLSSDAPVQFNSIMYVPKTNTEIYGWIKSDPGIDLYSRKVLIQKACSDILPEYFRFIKGVVDSEDIPLNISRETIQSDLKVNKIRKHLLKKIFEQLKDIKDKDKDKYEKIWKNYQRNFKEGVPNEYEYREQLAALLLFYSSKNPKDKYTDLDEYVSRMPEDQFEIYYALGIDYDSIEKNPALEAFKKKDLEVLYFTDPMDGWTIDHLQTYKGKMFRPVEAADIKLEEDEKEKDKKNIKDAENLASYLKVIYGDKIEEVRVSQRLVDSPCIMVNSKNAPSIQLERMMRLQNQKADFSKKILEINPKNKLIKSMVRIHKAKPDSEELKTLGLQLLDNMILREGVTEDIENIVPRIHEIMYQAAQKA